MSQAYQRPSNFVSHVLQLVVYRATPTYQVSWLYHISVLTTPAFETISPSVICKESEQNNSVGQMRGKQKAGSQTRGPGLSWLSCHCSAHWATWPPGNHQPLIAILALSLTPHSPQKVFSLSPRPKLTPAWIAFSTHTRCRGLGMRLVCLSTHTRWGGLGMRLVCPSVYTPDEEVWEWDWCVFQYTHQMRRSGNETGVSFSIHTRWGGLGMRQVCLSVYTYQMRMSGNETSVSFSIHTRWGGLGMRQVCLLAHMPDEEVWEWD